MRSVAMGRFRSTRRGCIVRLLPTALAGMFALVAASASAQTTYNVTVGADDGTGGTANTLSWAILQATSAGDVIDIQTDVTLSGSLKEINVGSGTAITVEGNNHTIDGNGRQIFTVTTGNVTFQNMTITGGLAQGGTGGNGNGGGGGGLGSGGGLYIGSNVPGGANVTLDDVLFNNNQAVGGNGGTGDGSSPNGGDGGGYNANANSSTAGTGGASGGSGDGANGGYGGGGAGAGSGGTSGGAGNGGGSGGGPGVGGGGGLALGGAVFVANGTTLTIKGSTGIASSNTATGGTGGSGTSANGADGNGNGGGLYVGIESTANFDTTAADITVTGNVYANGRVTIDGNAAGNVFLLGANVFSGSSTITLSSGTLNLNSTQTTVISGAMEGAGGLNLAGTGTVFITGTSSYAGGTTVGAGVLQGNTSGLQGTITNSSVVRFLNVNGFGTAFDGGFNGTITGTGDVVVTGSGMVTFSTANSYTGNTTVDAGRLRGNAESMAPTISLTNGGEVIFNQDVGTTATDTYTGLISGTGNVTFAGSTMIIFSQQQTYGGTTTFNLTNGANITTTAFPGNIVNNTVLTYSQNTGGTYAGNMSGTGALVLNMTGTLLMSGTNTYTGGTTLTSGTLEGDTASIQGNIANGTLVLFNQTTTGTYAGSMSGSGGVKLVDSGTVVFTGTNTYAGGTTVEAGTLFGNTFSLQGYFDNGAEIDFNQNFTGTFTGTLDGIGSLVKTGTGNLILTGTQTYAGHTTIENGRLSVNGALDGTSIVYIQPNGTLGGTGFINAGVVNEGTLAPGNSIGTMTVANYTSLADSVQQIEINNSGTVPGVNNDLLVVTGDVTLSGGTVSVLTTTSVGFTAGSRYVFIDYGGNLTGSFAGATINTPFLTPTLDYATVGEIAFYLYRSATTYTSVTQNYNQFQVASYLDQNSTTASGDFADVLDQVNLLSAAEARSAFDEMQGAVYGTSAWLNVQAATYMFLSVQRNSDFEGEFGSPRDPRGAPLGYARSDDASSDVVLVGRRSGDVVLPVFRIVDRRGPVWNAWTTGYGSIDSGDSNLAQYAAAGNITSLYRYFNEVVKFGVFGAYNYVRVPTVTPQQSVATNDAQFGSYLRADDGRKHCLLAHSVGFDDYDSSRLVQFGGINRTARGDYDGWQTTAYGEVGGRFAEYPCDIEPFYALQYTYLRQNAFQETGADSLNLNVDGIDTNALRQLLGARFIHDWLSGSIEFRGVWVHEYLNPTTVLNSTFAGVGGSAFSTQGADFGRDNWLLGGGVSWYLTERLSLAANYDAFITNKPVFHLASGTLQYRW